MVGKWLTGVLVVFAVAGCDSPDERWLAMVYPDARDLTHHDVIGEFPSLNLCLDACRGAVATHGSYECGLNCEQRPSGMNVCERTVGNER